MCKISIITVVYNSGNKLCVTFDSVVNQSFKDYELIVIDGNSTDNTLDVVKTYCNKVSKLRVYSEKDSGIYDAMNKGISYAKGNYIYFLNAGDFLYDFDVFEVVAKAMDGVSVLYGNAITHDCDSGKDIPYRVGKYNKYRLAHTNICHQAIFYPRSAFINRRYNLKYRLFADWVLNMQLWNSFAFKYVNKNVVLYENGGVSAVQTDKCFINEKKGLTLKYLGLD